jgi:hypothetical protein
MHKVLLVLLAAGIAVAVVFAVNGPSRRPVIAFVIAGAVVLAIVVPTVRASIRKRRAAAEAHLEDLEADHGLVPVDQPDKKLHRRFGALPGIPKHGDVKIALEGTVAGRPLTAFQHHYIINTGQAVIPVYHAVFVTPVPVWPKVKVQPRGRFGRLLMRFNLRRGMTLDDPRFNRQCRVTTDDEDFALVLLHPEMQHLLAEKPSITWHVGGGWCAMIYNGQLRLERMPGSLDRLERFWALVPPELDAWESA